MYRTPEMRLCGATDRELRALRKNKERVILGIYRDKELGPWEKYKLACEAYISRLAPGAALAGPSAALFWGLPKTMHPPQKVFVCNLTRGRYHKGIQILGDFGTVEHEGLVLTTPAATAASCATLMSSRDSLIVADAVLAEEWCTAPRADRAGRRNARQEARRSSPLDS